MAKFKSRRISSALFILYQFFLLEENESCAAEDSNCRDGSANDNNGFSDQHTPPRAFGDYGGIDWQSVLEALSDVGYSGTYNFELALSGYGEYLEKTVKFLGGYLRAFIDGKL